MTSRKHHADDGANGNAGISNHDREAASRLIKRLGFDGYVRLGEGLARSQNKPGKRRGPSPSLKLPHSIMAALHHCWQQHNGGGTISKFQRDLRAAVEIKYSRKNPNLDQVPDRRKKVRAFGTYLNRAEYLRDYLLVLLMWRFGALERGATWKTQAIWASSPLTRVNRNGPYFRTTPKKPSELIKWIDAAIAADKELQMEAQRVRGFSFRCRRVFLDALGPHSCGLELGAFFVDN